MNEKIRLLIQQCPKQSFFFLFISTHYIRNTYKFTIGTHLRRPWATVRTDTTSSRCNSRRPRSTDSFQTIWWTRTVDRTNRTRPGRSSTCWWNSSSVPWWARPRTACCLPHPRLRRPAAALVVPRSVRLSWRSNTSGSGRRVSRNSPLSMESITCWTKTQYIWMIIVRHYYIIILPRFSI